MWRSALACVALLLLAAQAQAAVVSNIQGGVFVDKGNGFVRITSATTVNPGDRIRVNPNSNAQIYYDNGCGFNIEPSRTIVVRQNLACAGNTDPATKATGGNTTAYVVGGAVIIGGGVGIYALLNASP